MAYNKDTQTITSPVTMRDVQLALGTSVNTLQGLCTSPNINILSKGKPVPLNQPFTSTNPYWWRSGNCGINIPQSANYKDIIDAKWTHNTPKGGTASPYRLTDFSGYSHRKSLPIKIQMFPISIGNTISAFFEPIATDGISIFDVIDFGKQNSKYYAMMEITNKVGNKSVSARLDWNHNTLLNPLTRKGVNVDATVPLGTVYGEILTVKFFIEEHANGNDTLITNYSICSAICPFAPPYYSNTLNIRPRFENAFKIKYKNEWTTDGIFLISEDQDLDRFWSELTDIEVVFTHDEDEGHFVAHPPITPNAVYASNNEVNLCFPEPPLKISGIDVRSINVGFEVWACHYTLPSKFLIARLETRDGPYFEIRSEL